ASRPPRRRARPGTARPAEAERTRGQAGPPARVCGALAGAGRRSRQVRPRRPARGLVPWRAQGTRARRPPRRVRALTRPVPHERAGAPRRRARAGARGPRPPPLDARDARALAARARRFACSCSRVTRRTAYGVLALVCALPRLGVLLHERDRILSGFTEKS